MKSSQLEKGSRNLSLTIWLRTVKYAPRNRAHGDVHRGGSADGCRREGVFFGGGLIRGELAGECLSRDGDAEEDVLGLLAARRRQPRRQLREVEVGAHGLEEAVAVDVVGVLAGPEMEEKGTAVMICSHQLK